MTSEDKKNISEALKNIVIAISICIGGVWAIYTFDARLEAQNARAKLEKINNELTQRPVLIPKILVSIAKGESIDQWLLKIKVIVLNLGNTDAEIDVLEGSVRVARIEMKEGVVSNFKNRIYLVEKTIPNKKSEKLDFLRTAGVSILAGQTKELTYLAAVPEPGLYQIDFNAKIGKSVLEFRKKLDTFHKHTKQRFKLSEIIYIGEGPNKSFHPAAESGR